MDTPINDAIPYPVNTNNTVLKNDLPDATFSKLEFPHRRPFNIGVKIKESDLEAKVFPIEHQWRVFQSDTIEDKIEFTIRGGTVEWGVDFTVFETKIDAPTEGESIWCEITVDAATQNVITAEIKNGVDIPEDSDTKIHWLIAVIYNRYPDTDYYPAIRQIQFEPIRRLGTGTETGSDIYHPWKVTDGGKAAEGGIQQWDYAGGEIYTQGTMQTVPSGTLTGAEGFVVLAFDRDSATREIIPESAKVTLEPEVPISEYFTQYRALAKVNDSYSIKVLQLQFEELRIYEELVVENGAFKLQAYELSHRTNYDLPA